ncbi:cyclic nucleotide-binding domain-containing protein [Crocosphaera sp.]|uniref:cyclic nucleotide-binding domain-containing protein n=1 Tax=Crocosphaera sp. TaxID=2729996 RepID=UPI003F269E35|nr:mechanosensitive ion channel [Crocosphaera sp.]
MKTILDTISYLLDYPIISLGNQPISINIILQIILSFVITIILARAITILCKNWLFKRLGIEPGHREAFSTLIFYCIITCGIIISLQATGLNLQALAVVAGGLGIGVGFGLQSIIKDFISGLILLLGRSIKVNDFIQFGSRQEFSNLQGTVQKISLLFTVMKTKDAAYLIIPNSYLVIFPIINWNYEKSDHRVKIILKVGKNIDFLLFTEIVLDTAHQEASVKTNPSPKLIFQGIHDYYCEFTLQVWINEMKDEDFTINRLNYALEYYLRKNGINLIFPNQHLAFTEPHINLPILLSENNNIPTHSQTQVIDSSYISLRDILSKSPYFEHLNPLELRELIAIGYRQKLDKETILFHEGDPGDSFYIILSGAVEIFVPKINKYLATLRAGDMFGELALILGIPRTASVKTVEKTRLFVINKLGFQTILQEQSNIAEVIFEELSQHQEELAQRQQQLRDMGLISEEEDDVNLVNWVKKRFHKLFSL